jgi:hypothetical protein
MQSENAPLIQNPAYLKGYGSLPPNADGDGITLDPTQMREPKLNFDQNNRKFCTPLAMTIIAGAVIIMIFLFAVLYTYQ